jgi:type VI secretion system protein ImpM
MATTEQGGAGFFGKVPSHGDFVSRRLPADFVAPWDAWLQAGLADSRVRLGDGWLPIYLNSPIWRFALGAGVCGPQAWAGVMMPSVDRVGRYFPLTLVHVVSADGRTAPCWPVAGAHWYHRLETLALSCLDAGFLLARFDTALARMAAPDHAVAGPDACVFAGQARFWRDGATPLTGQGLPSTTTFTGEFLCS